MIYPKEKLFLVCIGDRCRGDEIRSDLKDLNKKLGRKATVRVCAVSCLDLCDYGPNMVVEPGHRVYSGLDRDTAREVYEDEMANPSEPSAPRP